MSSGNLFVILLHAHLHGGRWPPNRSRAERKKPLRDLWIGALRYFQPQHNGRQCCELSSHAFPHLHWRSDQHPDRWYLHTYHDHHHQVRQHSSPILSCGIVTFHFHRETLPNQNRIRRRISFIGLNTDAKTEDERFRSLWNGAMDRRFYSAYGRSDLSLFRMEVPADFLLIPITVKGS